MLTEQSFEKAAAVLGVTVPALKAVVEVEAPRGAFDSSGRPVILFEPHKFHKHTSGRYAGSHPLYSYRRWKPKAVSYRQDQWKIFEELAKLDRDAVVKSCSWGRFQILGENWIYTQATSLQHFEQLMRRSEEDHLEAFVRFIRAHPKAHYALRVLDFDGFAEQYNGEGHSIHQYGPRMEKAFVRYGGKK